MEPRCTAGEEAAWGVLPEPSDPRGAAGGLTAGPSCPDPEWWGDPPRRSWSPAEQMAARLAGWQLPLSQRRLETSSAGCQHPRPAATSSPAGNCRSQLAWLCAFCCPGRHPTGAQRPGPALGCREPPGPEGRLRDANASSLACRSLTNYPAWTERQAQPQELKVGNRGLSWDLPPDSDSSGGRHSGQSGHRAEMPVQEPRKSRGSRLTRARCPRPPPQSLRALPGWGMGTWPPEPRGRISPRNGS